MLKPLNEHVIVKAKEEKETTEAGLILPSSAKEKPTLGNVVAIAADVDKDKFPVKEGDEVLFEKYAGNKVKYNGEEYLMMKAKDIIAIVE